MEYECRNRSIRCSCCSLHWMVNHSAWWWNISWCLSWSSVRSRTVLRRCCLVCIMSVNSSRIGLKDLKGKTECVWYSMWRYEDHMILRSKDDIHIYILYVCDDGSKRTRFAVSWNLNIRHTCPGRLHIRWIGENIVKDFVASTQVQTKFWWNPNEILTKEFVANSCGKKVLPQSTRRKV